MLTITVAVGLLPLVSTTVDAASYDYPYITCLTDTSGNSVVYLSQDPIHVYTSRSTSAYDVPYFYYIGCITDSSVLELCYNTSLTQWQTNVIHTPTEQDSILYILGSSTQIEGYYNAVMLYGGLYATDTYQKYGIIINSALNSVEQGYFTSYSNDITQLPRGLTEDDIRDIIDEQINSMSDAGTAATTIINNTTIQYNSYQAGDVTSEEMQQNVTDNVSALNDLTPSTLLDAMQINNGLTYNQIIQDDLNNHLSDGLATEIASYVNEAQNLFNSYRRGELTQSVVLDRYSNINRYLARKVYEQGYNSTADINAINMAINTINNYTDQVSKFKDLETSVSDKSQASDTEELELLNEMVSVMQQEEIENPMQNQQTMTDAQTVRDSISDIWLNKYMLALTAMFGMLVIPCIILRTHYRLM